MPNQTSGKTVSLEQCVRAKTTPITQRAHTRTMEAIGRVFVTSKTSGKVRIVVANKPHFRKAPSDSTSE